MLEAVALAGTFAVALWIGVKFSDKLKNILPWTK